MIIIVWTILAVLILVGVFVFGRKYERKQFVRIGTRKPTTQDVILGGKK